MFALIWLLNLLKGMHPCRRVCLCCVSKRFEIVAYIGRVRRALASTQKLKTGVIWVNAQPQFDPCK